MPTGDKWIFDLPKQAGGSWQCSGCGTNYPFTVMRCECSTHIPTTSSGSTHYKLVIGVHDMYPNLLKEGNHGQEEEGE
jgi:hypothetical protein